MYFVYRLYTSVLSGIPFTDSQAQLNWCNSWGSTISSLSCTSPPILISVSFPGPSRCSFILGVRSCIYVRCLCLGILFKNLTPNAPSVCKAGMHPHPSNIIGHVYVCISRLCVAGFNWRIQCAGLVLCHFKYCRRCGEEEGKGSFLRSETGPNHSIGVYMCIMHVAYYVHVYQERTQFDVDTFLCGQPKCSKAINFSNARLCLNQLPHFQDFVNIANNISGNGDVQRLLVGLLSNNIIIVSLTVYLTIPTNVKKSSRLYFTGNLN